MHAMAMAMVMAMDVDMDMDMDMDAGMGTGRVLVHREQLVLALLGAHPIYSSE